MNRHKISPSLLAADFNYLADAVHLVNESVADWFHLDVMDGIFVPNISFGFPIIQSVKKMARKPLDVHLMIEKPERYLKAFADAGADVLTVHYEACTHLHRTIEAIKEMGIKAGVAINPHTNVSLLEDVLEMVDLICVMSVNPGFGGQRFIYQTLPKIKKLREMAIHQNVHPLIEVDGGVGLQNAESILQAGADVLVAGSSIFKAENPEQTILNMKNIGSGLWV